MRTASSLVAATLLLVSTCAFAETPAPAAEPGAPRGFATQFFEACFFAGPTFEDVVAALDAKGAVHLPERAGKREDGSDTIHGFMVVGPPSVTFMVEKRGSCVAVAKGVEVAAAKAALENFDRAISEKWKPVQIDVPPSDNTNVLASYHYAMGEQLVLAITLFKQKESDEDTFLSRQVIKR